MKAATTLLLEIRSFAVPEILDADKNDRGRRESDISSRSARGQDERECSRRECYTSDEQDRRLRFLPQTLQSGHIKQYP